MFRLWFTILYDTFLIPLSGLSLFLFPPATFSLLRRCYDRFCCSALSTQHHTIKQSIFELGRMKLDAVFGQGVTFDDCGLTHLLQRPDRLQQQRLP